MGCGMSTARDSGKEPELRPREHHKKVRHGHDQYYYKTSQKQPKDNEPKVSKVHQCTSSNHPECVGVSFVSPSITLQDGSRIKVSWAPCGLNYAKGWVSEMAENPTDAELLVNSRAPQPQQRGRSRQAQPVPPEMDPGFMSGGGAGASTARMEPDYEDDMVYDLPNPNDPYAGGLYAGDPYAIGEDIEMGTMPPRAAHRSGTRRKRNKAKNVDYVPGPFGTPVPAPGQGGMPYDDPGDPWGEGFAGGQEMPLDEDFRMGEGMGFPGGPDIPLGEEGYEGSSGMGSPAAAAAAAGVPSGSRSGSSWAGSTVPPAARPPKAKWVRNLDENFYQGGDGVNPPGVAIARERERAPVTATGFTATAESCNTVRYSRRLE